MYISKELDDIVSRFVTQHDVMQIDVNLIDHEERSKILEFAIHLPRYQKNNDVLRNNGIPKIVGNTLYTGNMYVSAYILQLHLQKELNLFLP